MDKQHFNKRTDYLSIKLYSGEYYWREDSIEIHNIDSYGVTISSSNTIEITWDISFRKIIKLKWYTG